MTESPAVRMSGIVGAYRPVLSGTVDGAIEEALGRLEPTLAAYDATSLRADELRVEWDALIALYRAVRSAHATMQSYLRSSDVAEQLTHLYYALRSIQGSLSMAYVVAGPAAERPETSPVGTAIGLFDAPKLLAQETHLQSGSYDAILPYFARWMGEIYTDVTVRYADYLRFYGETDVPEAHAALRRILGLAEDDAPHLFDFEPGGAEDPSRRRSVLARRASDPDDLVGAVHLLQEVGHEARMYLVSLLAHRDRYVALLGEDQVQHTEALLADLVQWPFPVGETPLFDLAAEQEAFDAVLGQLPVDRTALRDPALGWAERLEAALRQACRVEQSLRDHRDAYRDRYHDPRFRRSFRWYVWELLGLLEQTAAPGVLGARREPIPQDETPSP